jgi:long-chain acyl-CoA synthetase
VIAAPDVATGEAVLAVVVPRPGKDLTPEQVQAHVAAHLAPYKVPSRVVIRSERLPRNPAGASCSREN